MSEPIANVAADSRGRSARAEAKSPAQLASTSAVDATGSSSAYSALPGRHSTSQTSQFAAARTGNDVAA